MKKLFTLLATSMLAISSVSAEDYTLLGVLPRQYGN